MAVALITGASRGLGLALARSLAARQSRLVIDARGGDDLDAAASSLGDAPAVVALPGDVADEGHRRALVDAAVRLGGLDALVNNASVLGPSPQPPLDAYPIDVLEHVYAVNVLAPLRLVQLALPLLVASGGRIVNVTSDAGVEAYEGWGGYGSSKAALEHLSRTLALEHPQTPVYWVDPGDMNTRMQQEAFPGEDISDRLPPEASVPGLLRLLDENLPSGRYQARDLAPAVLTR
jgi:NAD(P)-dependent dehydrogenase (short-subunit alcohol dehydrogenase family)